MIASITTLVGIAVAFTMPRRLQALAWLGAMGLGAIATTATLWYSSTNFSGEGRSTKYGWPHFVAESWKSFDGTSTVPFTLDWVYLAVDTIAIGSLLFVLLVGAHQLNQLRLRSAKRDAS